MRVMVETAGLVSKAHNDGYSNILLRHWFSKAYCNIKSDPPKTNIEISVKYLL